MGGRISSNCSFRGEIISAIQSLRVQLFTKVLKQNILAEFPPQCMQIIVGQVVLNNAGCFQMPQGTLMSGCRDGQ